jgi:hypothetical protein
MEKKNERQVNTLDLKSAGLSDGLCKGGENTGWSPSF